MPYKVAGAPEIGQCPCDFAVCSRPDAVVEVNHAAFETAFVKQFELQTDI